MLSEPMTLYKLMILYMLKQVKFPLTNSNISDFFVSKEYTTYFIVQQALTELLEANLISVENINNTSRYEMTKEGEEALSFFGNQISPAIITDINEFIQENKFRMRNDLIVHCEVLEGKTPLINIEINSPDEEQATIMTNNWRSCSQDIYQYIMKKLLGGIE